MEEEVRQLATLESIRDGVLNSDIKDMEPLSSELCEKVENFLSSKQKKKIIEVFDCLSRCVNNPKLTETGYVDLEEYTTNFKFIFNRLSYMQKTMMDKFPEMSEADVWSFFDWFSSK